MRRTFRGGCIGGDGEDGTVVACDEAAAAPSPGPVVVEPEPESNLLLSTAGKVLSETFHLSDVSSCQILDPKLPRILITASSDVGRLWTAGPAVSFDLDDPNMTLTLLYPKMIRKLAQNDPKMIPK